MIQADNEVIVDKPNIIYFRNDHITTPTCSSQVAEEFDFSWTCPSTWAELSESLQIENAFLAIHVDMMTRAPVTNAIEFMDALATITKFMPCHSSLRIGVVITSTTPLSVIRDLQKTQCQGILLDIRDYPNAEVNKALNALHNNIPYWPKYILDQLPVAKSQLPHGAYFVTDDTSAIQCTPELIKILNCTWSSIYSWSDLVHELESGTRFVTTHATMLKEHFDDSPEKFVEAVESIVRCVPNHPGVSVSVIINPSISQEYIRRLQKSKVMGILLGMNFWSPEECVAGVAAITAGKPYWPEHIISQLPAETKKPLVLHFRENFDMLESYEISHEAIQAGANCRRLRVRTWNQFLIAVQSERPEFITIHHEVINAELHSLSEFIKTIRTMLQYLPLDKRKTIPIAIGIDRTCSTEFIEQLKKLRIAGIHPAATEFGDDEVIKAIKVLLTGADYWPEDIINQLPSVPARPLTVYFREDWVEYSSTMDFEEIRSMIGMDISCYTGWDDLGDALLQNPHQLVFHANMLKRLDVTVPEVMSMLETKLKLAGLSIPIAAGFDPDTPVSLIKELKKAGVFGVIPSIAHWGIDECIAGTNALKNRIPYWPKHIIDQLPGTVKKKTNAGTLSLTVRQEQVFKFITERGASNKVIAKSLGISESTVKLHVTEIFKKYGVRNRTQLAVFSSES